MKKKNYLTLAALSGLLISGSGIAAGLGHLPNFAAPEAVVATDGETSTEAPDTPEEPTAPEAPVISTDPSVKVTTDYCSPWETLEAVNDGKVGPNSQWSNYTNKNNGGIYGNWDSRGQYRWIMYEFPNKVVITEAAVYWCTDNGGLQLPDDAYIECYDEATGEFVKQGNLDTAADKFNTLAIESVLTNKIRVFMMSKTESTAIVEFQVKGIVPEKTPFASYGSSVDNGEWQEGVNVQNIGIGQSVSFAATIDEADYIPGTWAWKGPNGFTSSDSLLTVSIMDNTADGTYTVSYTNEQLGITEQSFHLTVYDGEIGSEYSWKKYTPSLNYDFRVENPDFPAPTKDMEEFPVAGRISDGWWTYAWGPKANYLGTDKVGEEGIRAMLARMNKDFAYFRDVMGWPPDLRARDGYRSTIYLFGSGLPTDNADSTALGGWQSGTFYNGKSYPMVLISYYPVYCFHPDCKWGDAGYQTGAVVHEGIHALLADLPGCKGSAWIQEGGNTWLQQEYESRVSGSYNEMGFLNAPALIAPFMPIECYSGWLLDGSFGGPAAEGVNVYNEKGEQLCNWRNLLGGTQYGNLFVVYLGQTLGDGVVPWIWRNCPNRVLEGMGDSLGSDQMRRLITEYRAKQAMLDFGKWTNATKKLLNNNFGGISQEEYAPFAKDVDPWKMTPYVVTHMENNVVVPEERTLPGWSGANQIPLMVERRATRVRVDFRPIGKNMTLQLCYRTKSGKIVYSTPVTKGECILNLPEKTTDRPANNVVIAVVSNTDYIYEGDETRKAKFDYRIALKEGAWHSCSPYKKWYEYTQTITDNSFVGIEEIGADKAEKQLSVYPTAAAPGEEIQVTFYNEPVAPVRLSLVGMNSAPVMEVTLSASGKITLPSNLSRGVYLLTVDGADSSEAQKIIIR